MLYSFMFTQKKKKKLKLFLISPFHIDWQIEIYFV